MYHSPVTNALWEARSKMYEGPTGSDSPASELVAKTPAKSRTSILYKFSSDYILREQYRNPWSEIRLGKLLEDLDALAGTISFKLRHILLLAAAAMHPSPAMFVPSDAALSANASPRRSISSKLLPQHDSAVSQTKSASPARLFCRRCFCCCSSWNWERICSSKEAMLRLITLNILGCPMLDIKGGDSDYGSEWPQISHIPVVIVDDWVRIQTHAQ
ncbi:hypothetical protein ABFS83_07G101400 [Erythranthe nasuta]